jgi:integrase
MPKDTKTRYRDVFARHKTGCAVERDSDCTCTPTYWGKAWDSAAGKRRKTRFFSTASAARKAKADLEVHLSSGDAPVNSRLRVDRAIDAFLAGTRDGSVLNKNGRPYKPSAIRTLAGALEGPLSQAIGTKRLQDVRRGDLQRLLIDQLTPTHSGSSVRRVVNSIRSLYTWAQDREHADHDPAHRVRLPPVNAVPRDRVATPAEFAELLAVLPIEDALPYALAGYATARRAEIRNADLDDVDLAVFGLYLGSDETGRKTRAAQRVAPIVRPLAPLLRRAQIARDPNAGKLLCPGRKAGGRNSGLLSCEALQMRSDKAWAKAGLKRITLHECRHTAISWLDAAGVRHQVISTIAGHELKHGGAQVTARYTHTLPGDLERARQLLDAYLAEHMANSKASRAPKQAKR